MLGPRFGDEIFAAGLGGLLFSWSSDGTISGRENLTQEQNASLDAVIAAHDPDAQTDQAIRSDSFLSDSQRAELVGYLKTATPAQIEAFVRSRLNADDVTNLASAILFCKRVETAFVQLAKAICRFVDD